MCHGGESFPGSLTFLPCCEVTEGVKGNLPHLGVEARCLSRATVSVETKTETIPQGLAMVNNWHSAATQLSSCGRQLQIPKYFVFPKLGVGGEMGRCELVISIVPPTALPLRVTQLTSCPPLIGNARPSHYLANMCLLLPLSWVTKMCISGHKSCFHKC